MKNLRFYAYDDLCAFRTTTTDSVNAAKTRSMGVFRTGGMLAMWERSNGKSPVPTDWTIMDNATFASP